MSQESTKTIGKPRPKRRKDFMSYEYAMDIDCDDADKLSQMSSVSSRDQAPVSKSVRSGRGGSERATPAEKQPSIEDAVYLYRDITNSTRPPIFLQRNLVYLPQCRKRPNNSFSSHEAFEKLLEKLSNFATVSSQVQLTLTNILNIKFSPLDKKEITLDFYLLKNCYKRRKTDVTSIEKFVKSITLTTPLNMDTLSTNSITLDSNEISSEVGAYHISACYLKAKVVIATAKKISVAYKKPKKKYYPEAPEPKYQLKEYVSTLLLYSGGKSYLPSGKKTLFLQQVNSGQSHASPQYMDWNDLSAAPQIVLDVVQFSHRRSARSSVSPVKYSHLTNHRLDGPITTLSPIAENVGPAHQMNGGEQLDTPPSYSKSTDKLYFVMQCKGSSQTTFQEGFTCPFCLKKTVPSNILYLLKHLRLCHNRLLFLYKEADGDPAIIVTVNLYYDGSSCGNPFSIAPTQKHLQAPISDSFKRAEPIRRTPYTEVLNVRANRKKMTLEEFSRPEPLPLISNYSSLLGHNRRYYHCITNQPILSNDFDVDSDGEDAEWMRTASSRLIDEFIDVNKGEKELMKMWNNFISKNTQYISDTQMEAACLKFVSEHSEILSFKLRNNFLCHLATMYDCGVLQARSIRNIIDSMPKKPSGVKSKPPPNGGILTCNI